MALINDLVRQAREQANVTLEYAASVSDYSVSQVHRYERGECEVSFRYASRLFAATGDRRLLAAFSPGAAEAMQAIFNGVQSAPASREKTSGTRTPPPGDPRDLLQRELEALEELTRAARYVQQIVADGVIDDSDNTAIGQLLARHEHVAAIMAATDRAMVAYRDRTPRARGRH